MNEKTLFAGTAMESETVFRLHVSTLHVTLADCTRVFDPEVLSISEFHRGYVDVAFYLKGVKNVILDFGGGTLLLHGRILPFLLQDCENVEIRNVTVEYDRSFYTEMDILSCENGRLTLRPLEHFPVKVEDGYLIPFAPTWENRSLHEGDMFLQAFDQKTRQGAGAIVVVIGEEVKRHESPPCEVQQLKVRSDGESIVLLGHFPAHWGAGMRAVFAHEFRDKSNVMIVRSKDVLLENYRILNGAGMGILSLHAENLTFDHLTLTCDNRSHGIITNAADAIHLVATSGNIILRDCLIEGMVDDALNVHCNFYEAVKVEGKKLTLYRHPQSHFLNAYSCAFAVGDTIALYRGKALAEKGRAVITSFSVIDTCTIEIETDCHLPEVDDGDLVENLSTQANLTVERCQFGKSNTHLRLQTRGRIVFRACRTELPFLLTGDTSYWFEASPVRDLTVGDCDFIGGRAVIRSVPEYTPTADAPYYHSGIKIIGNRFDALRPFESRATDAIVFEGNTDPQGKPISIG